MIVPSLYGNKAFYDSTSALSGNPFTNNSTCGMSGTLKDCGLAAFPGGNIGYANRIEATGNWFTDILGTVRDVVAPTAANLIDTLAQKGFTAARKASGYTLMEVVQIRQGNQSVFGQKAKKPNGTFVVILADGSEVPFTSEIAAASQAVDPRTGLSTAQTVGIGVGVVAVVGLLFYFMSKRR